MGVHRLLRASGLRSAGFQSLGFRVEGVQILFDTMDFWVLRVSQLGVCGYATTSGSRFRVQALEGLDGAYTHTQKGSGLHFAASVGR